MVAVAYLSYTPLMEESECLGGVLPDFDDGHGAFVPTGEFGEMTFADLVTPVPDIKEGQDRRNQQLKARELQIEWWNSPPQQRYKIQRTLEDGINLAWPMYGKKHLEYIVANMDKAVFDMEMIRIIGKDDKQRSHPRLPISLEEFEARYENILL